MIGQGNVALDVARVLLHEPGQLASTDMPEYAVDALRRSQIDTVHIVGRRGPAQASFTNKEVREILNLPGVQCHFLPSGVLALNEASKAETAKERGKKRMIDLFAATEKKAGETKGEPKKNLYFHFLLSPLRFLANEKGHVSGIELARNELQGEAGNQKAVPTHEKETLECDVVFKSIGYKSEPLEGVPFDHHRGVVPNEHGRVVRPDGSTVPGLYVSGWMKRGPSGVIGTNRMDAEETVASMWADLAATRPGEKPGWRAIQDKLRERQVAYVDWKQWKAIEDEEHRRGQVLGKEREKFTSVPEMLDVAFKQ